MNEGPEWGLQVQYLPAQDFPSGSFSKPSSHSHEKEPGEFSHVCAQPPFCTLHSSTSEDKDSSMVEITHVYVLRWFWLIRTLVYTASGTLFNVHRLCKHTNWTKQFDEYTILLHYITLLQSMTANSENNWTPSGKLFNKQNNEKKAMGIFPFHWIQPLFVCFSFHFSVAGQSDMYMQENWFCSVFI